MSDKNAISLKSSYGLCIILFQIAVIANNVLGFDVQLFRISKICTLLFMITAVLLFISKRYIFVGKNIAITILFMVLTILCAIWAPYPDAVYNQFSTQLQMYILFFLTYMLFANADVDPKYFIIALYISGVCLALFTVYRYGIFGFMNSLNAGNRLGGEITNENTFGMIFSQAAIIAFYYILDQKKKILHMACFATFVFFSLSSGSKKAILMIAMGVFAICCVRYGIKRIWKFILIVFISGYVLWYLLNLPAFQVINNRLFSYLSGNLNTSDTLRANMVSVGWELIKNRPILGYGIQNYARVSGFDLYSHNNFIEVTVSTGLIGLVLYYIPYIRFFIRSWKISFLEKEMYYMLLFILVGINAFFGYGMVQIYSKSTWIMLGIIVAIADRLASRKYEYLY